MQKEKPTQGSFLEFLKAVINSIADPVFVKDEQHRWVYLNDAFFRMYGGNPETLIGQTDYFLHPKEEADVYWQKDDEVFATGLTNVNEERATDYWGQKRIILTKKNLYCAPDGERYIVGVLHDITEQRENEKEITRLNAALTEQYETALALTKSALISTESKLQRIWDSNIVGIFSWDLDGRILEANQGFLSMTGYTVEDLAEGALNWRHMLITNLGDADNPSEKLESWTLQSPVETLLNAKNGEQIDVLIACAFLNDRHEQGVNVVIDISKLKNTEVALKSSREALRKYSVELEHSNRELEQFAHGVAYGLQGPLRKIQNFSEHLRSRSSETLGSEGIDDLSRVIRTTYRMQSLIQDLLEVSKVKRRRHPLEPVDLSQIIQEVYYDTYFLLKETGGRLEIGTLPTIQADAAQMEQMFGQLVEFFLRSSPEDAHPIIHIDALEPQDNQCRLRICGKSLKISPAKIEKLFDPFSHFYNKSEDGDEGIGLALAYKIVERHGGNISVFCNEEKGTCFLLAFPFESTP